jgi:hypothetical protein
VRRELSCSFLTALRFQADVEGCRELEGLRSFGVLLGGFRRL